MSDEKITEPLPWLNQDCVKIRMIAGDVLPFGPTILQNGDEIVLPKSMAGQLLANGTAIFIEKYERT